MRYNKQRSGRTAAAAPTAVIGPQHSGRMGPPAPRLTVSGRIDEAQQKANAAAKQSAAMDIFGSLGF